jgi:hypothetical protein
MLFPHGNCADAVFILFSLFNMPLSNVRAWRIKRLGPFFGRALPEVDHVAFDAACAACQAFDMGHRYLLLPLGRIIPIVALSIILCVRTRHFASSRKSIGAKHSFGEEG